MPPEVSLYLRQIVEHRKVQANFRKTIFQRICGDKPKTRGRPESGPPGRRVYRRILAGAEFPGDEKRMAG